MPYFDLRSGAHRYRDWGGVRGVKIATRGGRTEHLNIVLRRLTGEPPPPPSRGVSSLLKRLSRWGGHDEQRGDLTDEAAVGRALLERLTVGRPLADGRTITIETDDEAVAALPWFLLHDGDYVARRGVAVRVRLTAPTPSSPPLPVPQAPWITVGGRFGGSHELRESLRERWQALLGSDRWNAPGAPTPTVHCWESREELIGRPHVVVLLLGDCSGLQTTVRSSVPLGPAPPDVRGTAFDDIERQLRAARPRLLVLSHEGHWTDALALKIARLSRTVPDVLVVPDPLPDIDHSHAAELLAAVLELRGSDLRGTRGTLSDAVEVLRDSGDLEGGLLDRAWSLDSDRPLLEPRAEDTRFGWREPVSGHLDRVSAKHAFVTGVTAPAVLLAGEPGAGFSPFLRHHVGVSSLQLDDRAPATASSLHLVELPWPRQFEARELTSNVFLSAFAAAIGLPDEHSASRLRRRCAGSIDRGDRLLVAVHAPGAEVPEGPEGDSALASVADFWQDLDLGSEVDASLVVITERSALADRWKRTLTHVLGIRVARVPLDRLTPADLLDFFDRYAVADPSRNQERIVRSLTSWADLLIEDGEGRYEALVPMLESLPWHFGRMQSRARRRGGRE